MGAANWHSRARYSASIGPLFCCGDFRCCLRLALVMPSTLSMALTGSQGSPAFAAALALGNNCPSISAHRAPRHPAYNCSGYYRLFGLQLSIWQNLFGGCWGLRNWSPAGLDVSIHFVARSGCKSVGHAAHLLLANSGHNTRNHAALVSWQTNRTT